MDLGDLELPSAVVEYFSERGIRELYPPQQAAVEAGIIHGENVVVAVPTASGKTLIAQLAMVSGPGTALYIVPLRALAAEKYAEFSDLPGVAVGIATGDYEASADEVAEYDILVVTSEKADALLRRDVPWLDDLGCVVVDEVHLVDDRARGPTLEVTVAKLMALRPSMQVVALSATVGNPRALAEWLDGVVIESDWRPVELRRGVFHDGRIEFHESRHDRDTGGDSTRALIRDILGAGGQCLVFVHSRRAAESLADSFGAEWLGSAPGTARAVRDAAKTETGERLAACVRDGVAFHHAGLRPDHRTLVEQAFRARDIDLLCATPTLAAGVNIPARRVVVRDHWRYTDTGREPLTVLEVHQMFGRAGRPGLDPYGEAVVVADGTDEAAMLWTRYIEGEPGPVNSKLASQDALRTHVLSTIASGFADTRAELLGVLEGTFYAAQADHGVLVDIADLVLDYLVDVGMVRRAAHGLVATPLGEHVSRLYVDPETGAAFVAAIESIESFDTITPLTILEFTCNTPDMTTLYLRGRDRAAAYRFAERHEDEFVTSLEGFEGDFDAWLEVVKTVRVLAEWIDGASEDAVTERHGIGPGDLRTTAERAEWLVGAAGTLAAHAESPVASDIRAVRGDLEARPV